LPDNIQVTKTVVAVPLRLAVDGLREKQSGEIHSRQARR